MAGDITRQARIIFNADTTQAQAQIQALAQSLQKAMNYGFESSGFRVFDQQLRDAALDATKLQAQLQAATNVNTGKLDLTKFNQSLKTSHTTLQQYQQSLSKLGTSGQAAFAQLAISIASAEVPMQRVSTTLNKLLVSLKNTITWNISSSIMNGFISSIQTAFNYSEKLNESLNRIQIVTGESSAQMAKFAEQANRSAQALSTTTRKYTDAALIFYQQGLNDSQVKARTDAVIKMANVTGDASKEVSNYMTAIWNNFDNGTSSLESFEDKIVSLGATTASSSAEIAAGLEKFAAVGNTIGLSFDYAAAALATVVAETRQSADTVGTAFRTLFSRLQGLKLGETLEDGTSLNKYSAALATVGVQIQDASGQLKNMDTILTDLAGNWDNLTQAQKVALAQTVGGARQYTTLISLMENWDQFQKNLATEAGSEGALQKQADTYAQSWEAAKDRVTASMEAIYSSLINDQFFIGLNNGIATVLQGINSLIKGMGGVSGVLSRFGALATTVFEKQITASLTNLTTNLQLMTKTGQEQMMMLKQQAIDLATEMTKTLTNGTKGEGQNYIKSAFETQLTAQSQIIQNNSRMTEQEQTIASIIQGRINARAQELVQLGQQITSLKEIIQTSGGLLGRNINNLSANDGNGAFAQQIAQVKELNAEISNLNVAKEQIRGLQDVLKDTSSFDEMKAKFEEFYQSIVNSGKAPSDSLENLKLQLDDFAKTAGISSEEAQTAFTQFAEAVKNEGSAINSRLVDVYREIETITRAIANVAREAGQTDLATKYEAMANSAHNLAEKQRELNKAQEEARQKSNDLRNENDALGDSMQRLGQGGLTAQESIVKFGQVLTSVSSLITQVTGLIDVWKDKDASLGKKLLTTITTIGMLLPLLVRMNTNLIALITGQTGAGAAAGVAAAGMTAEAGAAGSAAVATTAFGKALQNAIPIVGWILTAITLLVAGITALVKHLQESNRQLTDTEKLAQTKSQIDSLRESYEQLQTAIDNLTNVGSEWSELYTALENCTEGTSAWYDALAKVQDKTTEILGTYPILGAILKNPSAFLEGISLEDLYDEHHILKLDKLIDIAISATQGLQDNVAMGQAIATQTGDAQQGQLDYNTATEELFYDSKNGSFVYGYDNQNEEGRNWGTVGSARYRDLTWVDTNSASWTEPEFFATQRASGLMDTNYVDRDNLGSDILYTVASGSYGTPLAALFAGGDRYSRNGLPVGYKGMAQWALDYGYRPGTEGRFTDASLQSLFEARTTNLNALANTMSSGQQDAMTRYALSSYGNANFLADVRRGMVQYAADHITEDLDLNDIVAGYFGQEGMEGLGQIWLGEMFGRSDLGWMSNSKFKGLDFTNLGNNPIFFNSDEWNGISLSDWLYGGAEVPWWNENDVTAFMTARNAYSDSQLIHPENFSGVANTLINRNRENLNIGLGEETFLRAALPQIWGNDDSILGQINAHLDEVNDLIPSVLPRIQTILDPNQQYDWSNVTYDEKSEDGLIHIASKTEGQEDLTIAPQTVILESGIADFGEQGLNEGHLAYTQFSQNADVKTLADAGGSFRQLNQGQIEALLQNKDNRAMLDLYASTMHTTTDDILSQAQEYYDAWHDDWAQNLTIAQNEAIDNAVKPYMRSRVRDVVSTAINPDEYFIGDSLDMSQFTGADSPLGSLMRGTEVAEQITSFGPEASTDLSSILSSISKGQVLNDKDYGKLEQYLGDMSEFFTFVGDGWQFIGDSVSQLTTLPVSKLQQAQALLDQVGDIQIDITNIDEYADLLTLLGYTLEDIQSIKTLTGEDLTASLDEINSGIDYLRTVNTSTNGAIFSVDDSYMNTILNYAKSTAEITQILELFDKQWSDLAPAMQRKILDNLGLKEIALEDIHSVEDITNQLLQQDFSSTISEFIGSYSSLMTEANKELLDANIQQGKGAVLLEQNSSFKLFRSQLAKLLKVNENAITAEWMQANWELIENLASGNYDLIESSISQMRAGFRRPQTMGADELASRVNYLGSNLTTSTTKAAALTTGDGVNQLRNYVTDILLGDKGIIYQGIVNGWDETTEGVEPETLEKIKNLKQAVATLLGVSIDEISDDLWQEWAKINPDTGTSLLMDLVTKGKSGAALSAIQTSYNGNRGSNTLSETPAMQIGQNMDTQGVTQEGAAIVNILDRGMQSMVKLYDTMITSGVAKDYAERNREGRLLGDQQAELLEVKQAVADLLGVAVETITDDFIIRNNTNLQNLGSGDETISSQAVQNMARSYNIYEAGQMFNGRYGVQGASPINLETLDTDLIGHIFADYIQPATKESVSSSITEAVQAAANGDYSGLVETRLNRGRAYVASLAGKEATIKEKGDNYLASAGLIEETDEGWQVSALAQNLGYNSIEELVEGLINGMESAYANLDLGARAQQIGALYGQDIGNAVQTSLQAVDEAGLLRDQDITTTTDLMRNIRRTGGSLGLQAMTEILSQAGPQAGVLATALSSIDWSSADAIQQATDACNLLGISSEDLQDEFNSLVTAATAAANATNTLNEALNTYASNTSMADKIRSGEAITQEEYDAYAEQYGEDAAREKFRYRADGTWDLAYGVDREATASDLENRSVTKFEDNASSAQSTLELLQRMNRADSGLTSVSSENLLYNSDVGVQQAYWSQVQSNADKFGGYNAEDDYVSSGAFNRDMELLQSGTLSATEYSAIVSSVLSYLGINNLSDINAQIGSGLEDYAERSQEAARDASSRIESDNLASTVKDEIGMSAEDLENYAKVLAETRGQVKDFTKLSQAEQLEWKKLAALQAMAENGLTNFNKTALDNIDTMKNSKKGTKEYSDSLGELTKDVKHIFGNSKAVTEKFVEDNLGLIEDMANGVEGSAEEVEENILRAESAMSDWNYDAKLEIDVDGDGAIDEITTVGEYLNNFGDEYADMPIGFEIESDPAIDALNQMLQAGQMTATGITDALNDVGWMPEISYEEMTLGEAQEAGVKGSVQVVLPTGEVQEGTIEGLENVGADTMIRVPTINSAKKTGGGASGSLPSGRRGRGGGGRRGGGGGDRRKETGDRKKKENRYVTNTNQLEDIQDKLDKLNKAEERSYGRNRLKQMQDKTKILKDLAAKQKDLYDEAVAYQKADREALENNEWAKKMGIKFEFDENGTILDRDKIEQQMVDFYNSYTEGKDDEGNWILKDQSDSGKKKFKEMQEAWEELNEQLDKYDESQDKVKEYHQAILDSINEEYDNLVEMANYKVEIQVDVSDEALKILDFMLAKIEDDAYKAADAIAIMGQQAWEAQAQNRINDNGIRDILKVHNGETQYADADGNLHTTTNINKDIGIDKLMNGDAEAWGKLMSLEKEFTQDEVDALQGFMDAKIEQAQNLMELQKDVYAKVSEVFDKGTEDMDRLINKMDHLRTITSSYLNIVDLVGKKHLGITNDFLDEMQLSGVDQDINKVSASLTKLNTQRKMLSNFRNQFGGNTQTLRAAATADEKAEREAMAQRMERMGASAEAVAQVRASIASDQVMQLTQRDKDLITEEINHMEDEIQASTEDFHSAWEDAITSIADFYTAQIGRAIEDASDKLAGELGSLDELADKFAKTQEVNDLYVEDFEKIYEMSKLNRDILKSIDETDNVKAKQRLVEYQAELNQLEEDRAQMSEYEIENARRRYELLLAELALEESKNAKSQVQMARNDLGEWSYVYTADESAVEEAEQNYEDKLYAMQRANADYINSLQENIVDLQQRMVEEIEAIRIEDYASAEEYWNAINDIKEHYSTLMDGNMEQMDIVFNEQTRLYEEDWATYSEMTGYKISADEDYIDKWNETAISKLTGFETMEEYHRNFNDTTDELLKQCNESYEIWEDKVKETMEAAGTTMDDFTEQMNTDVGEMTSQSGELASSMETTGATIVQAFDDMTEALSNWQAEYSKSIEEMLEKNEALAKSFNNLLKEWSGYNEATGLDDSSGEGEGTGESAEEIEESTEEPAAEPMPEERRESPEAKTRRLKKGIAAAIWGYRGGAGWGHGNSSRKLTSGTRYRRFKEKGLIPDEVQQQINRYSGWSRGRMLDDAGLSYSDLKKYTYPHFAFDTGGYTGDWDGTDGRFALLHSKEIVLNKEDTANFLAGIEILRDITKAIDLNAMASAGYMAKIANAPTIGGLGTTLEQEVHITAEFPNATDRNEIEAAFGDIINLASQYANRQQ